MFSNQGGQKIIVGEGFQCHLPPIPPLHEILFHNLPKEEQYWRRQDLPAFYVERRAEERLIQEQEQMLVDDGLKKGVTHVDSVLEKYRRQQWKNRLHGVWFMNNGEPTYLTNHHWWYLQWCKWDHIENNGYPFYYEFSRNNFYIRQWCETNPRSQGYMFVGPRATGKSNEEIACVTNRATYLHNHRAAFQSKHFEDDAKGVLIQSKTVPLFNALPDFFKPNYAHGTNPQEALIFQRDATKGRKAKEIEFGPDQDLLSTIFAAMPGVKALDSDTLSDLFEDEIGKCWNPNTQFLTYKGEIKKISELTLRDQLMGPDSKPRNIIELKSGFDKAFKIIPKKSGWDEYICSTGHKMAFKWCWKDRPFKFNGKSYNKDETVVMTIDAFLKLPKAHQKHLMLFRVPVEYQSKPLFIDPYLMGVWLGDGDSARMSITTEDHEVFDWLYEQGYKISKHDNKGNADRYLIHGFSQALNLYAVKHNKYIPYDYLVNSRQNRLQLLAGIIDTDGYVLINGNQVNCEITQKNKRLALGIKRLATELGFNCSFDSKLATMKRPDGSVYKCEVYRMVLYGDLWEIPTKIKRKQAPKILGHHRNRKNPMRSGFRVEPQEDQEYIGVVLDGDKLHLLGDCQVTHNTHPKKVANIYERHEVNLKCVFRNHRKIGMLRKTSTVEEMTEGGEECFKLWRDSNPEIIDGNGYTTSKIHRHLISALDTDTSLENYVDQTGKDWGAPCNKFGQVDRKISNLKIQNDFDAVKHDLKKLSGRMRKNPRNETEAFIPDQSRSIFNVQLLTNRLNQIRNEMTKPPYVRGNLYWLKEKFGPVGFKTDEHAGRFNFAWFPDEYSNIKDPDQWRILNNVGEEWGWDRQGKSRLMKFPKNDHLFRSATDPIKFTRTKDPRASKAASHAFRLFDFFEDGSLPEEKWKSHNFIYEYINRPEDPETYLEDMAMAVIFLGMKMLPERNIPTLNEYFERNGLERFLFYPKKEMDRLEGGLQVQGSSDDAGYASTAEVIDYYTRRLITFINKHIGRMPFDNTIEDFLKFDSTNTTKSDPTVSAGLTLVHAEKPGEERNEKAESSLDDWFDTVDNSGTVGRILEEEELQNDY